MDGSKIDHSKFNIWTGAVSGAAFTAVTQIGTESSPGTRMVAVSGHVTRPGVYEIVNGTTTFRDLLYGDEFCQGIRNGNELKAFVPGGGSAPWFTPEQLDLPFEGRQVGAAAGRKAHHQPDGGVGMCAGKVQRQGRQGSEQVATGGPKHRQHVELQKTDKTGI